MTHCHNKLTSCHYYSISYERWRLWSCYDAEKDQELFGTGEKCTSSPSRAQELSGYFTGRYKWSDKVVGCELFIYMILFVITEHNTLVPLSSIPYLIQNGLWLSCNTGIIHSIWESIFSGWTNCYSVTKLTLSWKCGSFTRLKSVYLSGDLSAAGEALKWEPRPWKPSDLM